MYYVYIILYNICLILKTAIQSLIHIEVCQAFEVIQFYQVAAAVLRDLIKTTNMKQTASLCVITSLIAHSAVQVVVGKCSTDQRKTQKQHTRHEGILGLVY